MALLLLLGDQTDRQTARQRWHGEGCSTARTAGGDGATARAVRPAARAIDTAMRGFLYAAEHEAIVSHRDDRLGGPGARPHKTGGVKRLTSS
jgi:hypothetical protein